MPTIATWPGFIANTHIHDFNAAFSWQTVVRNYRNRYRNRPFQCRYRLAEHCYGGGRVIVDTITKEVVAHQPAGTGPTFFLSRLFAYAPSGEAACATEVPNDIKPGSDPNSIQPGSEGVMPVAILTTERFDATVDPLSVEFRPGKATEHHQTGHLEDVDLDGDRTRSSTSAPGVAVSSTVRPDRQAPVSPCWIPIHGCDAVRTR